MLLELELDWILSGDKEAGEAIQHIARCEQQQDSDVQQFINAGLDRAIAIIPQCIRDDARYLLFIWNSKEACLDIVTSDDNKKVDAAESVHISFNQWQQLTTSSKEEQADNLHFWIRDYLTTSSEFLHFSLIALFSSSDRNDTKLL